MPRRYRVKNSVSRYYSILFTLPMERTLYGFFITIQAILIASYYWTRMELLAISITYGVVELVVLAVYSRISWSVYRRFRRILGITIITQTILLLIGFIDPFIGMISATSLLVLGVIGIDGTSIPRYIVPFTPILTSTCLFYKCSPVYVAASITPIILDYINYLVMSRRRINGVKEPDLGTLFIQDFLEKTRRIEKLFIKLSKPATVSPRLLKACSTAVVYTDIHYGPFSTVGSSRFPSILKNLLRKYYENIIVFHGAGTHDRNIPVKDLSDQYASRIKDGYLSGEGWSQIKLLHWFRIKGGDGWDIAVLLLDKLVIFLVSRDKGIDDLPYRLQEHVEARAREIGLDAIVVDCHNHEKQGEMNVESLFKLLDKAMETVEGLRGRSGNNMGIRAATVQAKAPGLIDNEVTIVELSPSVENKPFYMVYMAGNNMVPGDRLRIKGHLSKLLGISPDQVEVLTNDEHSETGVHAGEPYVPVHVTNELLDAITRGTSGLASIDPCRKIELKTFKQKTRLMDGYAFKLLESLRRSVAENSALIILYLLLCPVLAWLITLL